MMIGFEYTVVLANQLLLGVTADLTEPRVHFNNPTCPIRLADNGMQVQGALLLFIIMELFIQPVAGAMCRQTPLQTRGNSVSQLVNAGNIDNVNKRIQGLQNLTLPGFTLDDKHRNRIELGKRLSRSITARIERDSG